MASGRFRQKNLAEVYGLPPMTPIPKWLQKEEIEKAAALIHENPDMSFDDAICYVLKEQVGKAKRVSA